MTSQLQKSYFVLAHAQARKNCINFAEIAPDGWGVTFAPVKASRSLDQNAISHAWYQQLARELRQDDAIGWKSFCKLHFGVQILRAEDDDFRAFYDLAIKSSLNYEAKLSAMRFVPVTSLMTKAQLSKYLEAVQSHFYTQGVKLEFPVVA